MLAVIGLSMLAIAVLMFESARVLTKIPSSPAWLTHAAQSNAWIIVVMALFATGMSLVGRFALDFETHTFGPIDGAGAISIVLVTGFLLRTLYAKRRRARAAPDLAGIEMAGGADGPARGSSAGGANEKLKILKASGSGSSGKGKTAA